jgi:hypothetical protein
LLHDVTRERWPTRKGMFTCEFVAPFKGSLLEDPDGSTHAVAFGLDCRLEHKA